MIFLQDGLLPFYLKMIFEKNYTKHAQSHPLIWKGAIKEFQQFFINLGMKHLTLNIPDNVNLNERETKRFLAAKMYEIGKLSLGQAAELVGLSKIAFSEILADYEVSLINYPPSDVIRDASQF